MTKLRFEPNLRRANRFDRDDCVLIYDAKLERISREFKTWSRAFPNRLPARAGENLKDLAAFSRHLRTFTRLAEGIPARRLTIVAAGGGSVGDFAGFLASVYKRGVRLVHVPTTWLAAIDSAHGGKTALNLAGAKNQLGTFHPANEVVLVRTLLEAQPAERASEAIGELAKIALIDGGSWVDALRRSSLGGADLLWKFLKPAIAAKMKVVSRDPRERLGARQVLNLGHTFGHVLEAELKWAHGRAVAQGLFFALEFSEEIGAADEKSIERALSLLAHLGLEPERPSRALKKARVRSLIAKDKKRDSKANVTFIVLRRIGKPERKEVPIDLVVAVAERHGWLK